MSSRPLRKKDRGGQRRAAKTWEIGKLCAAYIDGKIDPSDLTTEQANTLREMGLPIAQDGIPSTNHVPASTSPPPFPPPPLEQPRDNVVDSSPPPIASASLTPPGARSPFAYVQPHPRHMPGVDPQPTQSSSHTAEPFNRWRDYFAHLDPASRMQLEGDRRYQFAKEAGQRNGRLAAEELLRGPSGEFIRLQLAQARTDTGGKDGFYIGGGFIYELCNGAVIDMVKLEAGTHALLAIFIERHGREPGMAAMLREPDGVIFGEHDLSEEERSGGDGWEPINLRIKEDAVYLVDPSLRRGAKKPSDDSELEISRIIFNSDIALRHGDGVEKDRRFQSGDKVRSHSLSAWWSSYYIAAFRQALLEAEFPCMESHELVVGAPKFLFTHVDTGPQNPHRDYIFSMRALVYHGRVTVRYEPKSFFEVTNMLTASLPLSDAPSWLYDYGGAKIGAITRKLDRIIIQDMFKFYGVLSGTKPRSSNLRLLRAKKISNRSIYFDEATEGNMLRLYNASVRDYEVPLDASLLCSGDVPHHGARAPPHEDCRRRIDALRKTPQARQTLVRYCKEWPRYVNENVWKLCPRLHINVDVAKVARQTQQWDRAKTYACVGDPTDLKLTFLYDMMHEKYDAFPTFDTRDPKYANMQE